MFNQDQELRAIQSDLAKFGSDLARLKADAFAHRDRILGFGSALQANRLCLETVGKGIQQISSSLANAQDLLEKVKAHHAVQHSAIQVLKSDLAAARRSAQDQQDAPQEP